MRVLVDILHPAHVHKFRYIIKELESRGHKVLVTARQKDATLQLLQVYNIKYKSWKTEKETLSGKITEYKKRFFHMYNYCKKINPDVMLSFGGMFIVPLGKIMNIPTVISIEEGLYKGLTNIIGKMSTIVITPHTFQKELGKGHIRVKGYPELSYIENFKPEPKVLQKLNLTKRSKYFIIRAVSWKAIHDYGQKGFDDDFLLKICSILEKKGRVIITAESNNIPKELCSYEIKINPADMHTLMYYANLFIGDGQIMAAEAGLFGTPSIRFNSLVGKEHDCGKFDELNKRGIVHSYSKKEEMVLKLQDLLNDDRSKFNAQKRAKEYLKEMDNVTQKVVKIIEKSVQR